MSITFKMIIKTKITCPAQVYENEVSVIIFQKKKESRENYIRYFFQLQANYATLLLAFKV